MFQPVLDIIKEWRKECVEALKIDGQYALCDRDPVIDYVAKYCTKPESQQRGLLHAHTVFLFDERSVVQHANMRDLYVRLTERRSGRL